MRPSLEPPFLFAVRSTKLQLREVDVERLSNILRKEENCKLLETDIIYLADEGKQSFLVRTLLKILVPETRGVNPSLTAEGKRGSSIGVIESQLYQIRIRIICDNTYVRKDPPKNTIEAEEGMLLRILNSGLGQ